jgi:hypothetical protein
MSQARKKSAESVTLEELLEALDCGRSTLYRYMDQGLMPRPVFARRGRPAEWSPDALKRAKKIRKLVEQGYTLAAVEARLNED